AKPISAGNWSKWSVPILVNTTGVYRILAHVTDNQGTQNWTEVRFSVPFFSELASIQRSVSNVRVLANSTALGGSALPSS
ncbi:MAG: hypothetical protein WCF23_24450, partial [Candidatus Nitrosopolaris sp.]